MTKPANPEHKKRDLAMLVDHHQTSFFKHRPSILVLVISIIITAVTFFKMSELEHIRLQNNFEQLSRGLISTLKDSIENNLEVLNEFGGFYAASENISRSEFREFSNYILKRRSDIYMLAWSPRIASDEVAALRESATVDGINDFSIKQYDHRGLTIPAKDSKEYYPVFFVEPFEQNKSIVGLDQASYSLTQFAMRRSMETGKPTSTIVMGLPQFENEPPASRNGLQIFAPIFKRHTQIDTFENRRENLAGYVVVAMHIRRMLESVLKNVDNRELEMRIFAEGIRDKKKLIYTYNPQSIDKLKHVWTFTQEINVAGHTWTVTCSSTETFKKNNYRREAPAVFIIGILLGFLLAIYIFSFERNRIQDIVVALSLTDELTKLYNRRGFWLLADEQIRLSLRNKRGFWLLSVDLDRLKKINDTLGHPEGDRAIVRAAHLLKATFRKSDIVARIGGDEFAIIAVETGQPALPTLLANIKEQLKKHNASREYFYAVDLSTGSAYFDPNNPCSLEELMAQADKDLYTHKKARHAEDSAPNQ